MEKEDDKLFKRDIFSFDFRSNFLALISILPNIGKEMRYNIIVLISFPVLFVSTSFLVNIGKEMSLPGFRKKLTTALL